MTVHKITDVAAFAAAHAEFTNAILFSEDLVPEIRSEEVAGVEAAREHVLDVIVELLRACRDALVARADKPQTATMMSKNWNRDSSIRERKRVELGVLIESSYVETIYVWVDEEPSRPGVLSLVGEIGVQARRRDAIRRVAATGRLTRSDDENLRVLGQPLVEGTDISSLAEDLAEALWPAAAEVRRLLVADAP